MFILIDLGRNFVLGTRVCNIHGEMRRTPMLDRKVPVLRTVLYNQGPAFTCRRIIRIPFWIVRSVGLDLISTYVLMGLSLLLLKASFHMPC